MRNRNRPVKYAVINAAGAGNNTLVAAVTGKKIRVLAFAMVSGGIVTATFQTAAGGTALTGAIPMAANTQVTAPYSPDGHFETAASALLNLSLGGAVQVSGWLVYQEI